MGSDDFIIDMDKIEKKEASKKKKPGKKKKKQKRPSKRSLFAKDSGLLKHITHVEEEIKKQIEVRKLIKPTAPVLSIRKTTDLLGSGFHYFIELEEKITKDFFFDWLPQKIRKYIKLIIPFLVMLIVLNLNLGLDYNVNRALALFLCIALLWAFEPINMIVTALLIPVLAVALGLIHDANPFHSFSNPIIYLLLGGLIIAQAFRKQELDKMLAIKMLSLSKGNMKLLLLFTMMITAVLGMWMSNTATIALLAPVIISICSELSGKTEKNYTSMLLLAAGFSSSIGGLTTILGGNPNAITAAFLRNAVDFTFLDWTRIGFPVAVVLLIIVYLIFLKIYNVPNSKIDIRDLTKEAKHFKFTRNQRKLLMIFFPTIFLWLFGGELTSFLHLPVDFYRTEVIGLSAAILLFAFKVLEWEDVRRIPWEIFMLVGGGLTLGQILIDTGSASLIATHLFSLFAFLPKIVVVLIIVLMAILLTNFVNNSSSTIILVPVLIQLSSFLGINTALLAMAAAMATTIAPLTPIAMPSFSILYGTGAIERKEMIKTGLTVAMITGPILALMVYLFNFMM